MNHSISKYLKTVNIAAHRGSCGGNIPPNTSAAYEAALYQGANILEADVARSADGVFYMFHTGSGNEKYYLGIDCAFEDLTSKELDKIHLNNELGKDTLYRLNRLEDILLQFKGRCIINLDRSWEYWEEIMPMVRKMDMVDQILLKSPCKKEWIEKAGAIASDFAYMPIINEDIVPFYELGGEKGLNGISGPFPNIKFIITGCVDDRGLTYLSNTKIAGIGGVWPFQTETVHHVISEQEIVNRINRTIEIGNHYRTDRNAWF